jgi:hypothetical protein
MQRLTWAVVKRTSVAAHCALNLGLDDGDEGKEYARIRCFSGFIEEAPLASEALKKKVSRLEKRSLGECTFQIVRF